MSKPQKNRKVVHNKAAARRLLSAVDRLISAAKQAERARQELSRQTEVER